MEEMPFAQLMVDIVSKFLSNFPEFKIESGSFLDDLLKLATISMLRYPITGALMLLIRLPKSLDNAHSSAIEEYMEKPAYIFKESIIKIISAPLVTFVSLVAIKYFESWIAEQNIGDWFSILTKVIIIIVMSGVSILPLIISGTWIVTAILWRLLTIFCMEMLKSFIINTCCMTMYLAFTSQNTMCGIDSLIILLVLLALLEIFTNMIANVIAGNGLKHK